MGAFMPIDKPVSKTKQRNAAIAAKSAASPKIPDELIDQIVKGQPVTGEEVNAASMAFKKALIERAPGVALGFHLGYPSGADKPETTKNLRNGKTGKTILTEDGPLRINVPRDRDAGAARSRYRHANRHESSSRSKEDLRAARTTAGA